MTAIAVSSKVVILLALGVTSVVLTQPGQTNKSVKTSALQQRRGQAITKVESTTLGVSQTQKPGGQFPGVQSENCRAENIELAVGRLHQMPDLKGCVYEDIQSVVRAYPYPQTRVPGSSTLPIGQIYGQDPPAGTGLRTDTKIVLEVSDVVPSLSPSPIPEPTAQADIAVKMNLETPGPFFAGQNVKYEIVVKNAGPDAATNVRIVDSPINLTILDVGGDCKELQSCVIGRIENDFQATFNFTATIGSTGQFGNHISVSGAEFDPDPTNNTGNNDNSGTAENRTTPNSSTNSRPLGNQDTVIKDPVENRDPTWPWILLLAVGVTGFGTASVVTTRSIRRRKWQRLLEVRSTLDDRVNSTISPLKESSPSIGVRVRLDMGSTRVGPMNEIKRGQSK
jgi:conserved repeat domain